MLEVFRTDWGINAVYPDIIDTILTKGAPQEIDRPEALDSETYELHPAVVTMAQPRQRLVTSYGRPVNVAFALAEVLWILAGRRDVEMLEFYNSQIAQFSDNGENFNAAYGHRLRSGFDHDQIDDVIHTLQDDPTSRQATLVISHPVDDKGWIREPVQVGDDVEMAYVKKVTKDRACNLVSHLMIRNGRLDWLQVLRSNDAVWGVPYNMMQWTHLQEWIAVILSVPVGEYTFLADSLHIYGVHEPEARQIEMFDLYGHFGDHAEMLAGPDVLNILLREEQIIRMSPTLYEMPDEVREAIGTYWSSVLHVLAAWAAYKQNRNGDASELIAACDPVYGAALARFFFQNRWYKPEMADFAEDMRAVYADEQDVVNWITTRVES